MASTTRLVNKTRHMLKMQMGNSQFFSDLAIIKQGGEYKLHVNMNDTYREFWIGVVETDSENLKTKAIITSDDCCDFNCVTIQEVDGKIELFRQPRNQQQMIVSGTSASKEKPWFSWGMTL